MLAGLADSELEHLRETIDASMRRQDNAIERGVERALQVIPKPLRGRARSMLFPGAGA